MNFAIIKDSEIVCFSDEIPTKKIDDITGDDGEIIQESVEGMDFDMCIKLADSYDYRNDYQYINGKIVVSEKPIEQPIKRTKEDVQKDIGQLALQKAGMIELGLDTVDIEIQIQALKDEYATL